METPLTLFQGEDYSYGHVGFGWFGSKIVHSATKAVKSTTHFASNVVKTAGRQVGHVTKTIQSAEGAVSKQIGKIPVVGSPLHTVFDMTYHVATGPMNMTVAIAEGQRIDHVALNQLKTQLHDFKQVAPYAQMVISVVPGIGQGISGALSAGLALAEGQSITDALKAGLIGALPGGPLVKAVVTMGVETIQHVAKGDKFDFQTFSQTAGGVASSALGLPVAAKNALVAGIATTGAIASGKSIDKAVTDGAIMGLPLTDSVKKVMTDASTLSLDLAHGKKIDAAITSKINAIVASLPATNPLHINVKTGLDAMKKVGAGNTEKLMAVALQSGLADTLVSMGAQTLPTDAQKAIKSGIALGSGVVVQEQRKTQINKVAGKLSESGIQIAKADPLFGEARKIASTKNATKGFDLASGLLQQQVGLGDVATARNGLDATQKIGFDIAAAVRVGAVSNPKPATVSPAAHAGHAITLGMQSYTPAQKVAIMQTVQTNPSAAVGATVAVKEVATAREPWIVRVLKALGLRK